MVLLKMLFIFTTQVLEQDTETLLEDSQISKWYVVPFLRFFLN